MNLLNIGQVGEYGDRHHRAIFGNLGRLHGDAILINRLGILQDLIDFLVGKRVLGVSRQHGARRQQTGAGGHGHGAGTHGAFYKGTAFHSHYVLSPSGNSMAL